MEKIKIHEQQLKGNLTRAKKKNASFRIQDIFIRKKLFVVYWESCILSFNPNLSPLAMEFEKNTISSKLQLIYSH